MKPQPPFRADAEHGRQVLRALCCLLAFDVEVGFLGLLLLEQVQADATQDNEVLGPLAHADATVVFSKGHVQHPVALVLDAPASNHSGLSACR